MTCEKRMTAPTTILARDRELSCDTRVTGLNNNMLVLGPSGSGKTRHVLKPNLLQMASSFLVIDTKGTLLHEVGPVLAAHGYDVQSVDFADLLAGPGEGRGDFSVGYNPLSFVRRDPETGRPNPQDILSIANTVSCSEVSRDPFWDRAASNYLACCIAYVLEQLPEDEQHFGSVVRLSEEMGGPCFDNLMKQVEAVDPESYALRIWRGARNGTESKVTHGSILAILAEKVMCVGLQGVVDLARLPRQVDFARMGHERVALFVTVSDVDFSLEPLTSLFVSQAIKGLEREADHCEGGRLPVPVRLMLDDFSNLRIADFDKVISVLRSREIWCTLLLQTLSQLDEAYGPGAAQTIVGNCDEQLALAFQDAQTAERFSVRANRLASSLLETPPDQAWLFVRGRAGEQVRAYHLEDHPLYRELPEAGDGRPCESCAAEGGLGLSA